LHAVLQVKKISEVIRKVKSFTARSIIDVVKASGSKNILHELQMAKLSHKVQSVHQLWQEGSYPEEIVNEEMMEQKIEYIHENPVRRGYVKSPTEWRYSSAGDYEGMSGLLPIDTVW